MISGTAEARVVKFCTQVDCVKQPHWSRVVCRPTWELCPSHRTLDVRLLTEAQRR